MADFYLHQSKAPTIEPVTLREALLQCHADAGVEDEWFIQKIKAGTRKVEDYIHRSLMPQTWVLNIDRAPWVVTLPRPPIIKIKSVTLDGEAVSFELMEGLPNQLWLGSQASGQSLRVEYTAGYGKRRIPEPLRDAILLYVSYCYENRSGEADVPKAFYDLIEPYKLSV